MTWRLPIYLEEIKNQLPRMLSLLDSESFSMTFGCADRTYWSWKFTDFPGSRYQEIVYPLAWLHSSDSFDNPWRHHSIILEKLEAALNFWNSLQHRDGSFDEAYPEEHSLAATAFTSFYVSEALFLSRNVLSNKILESTLMTLTSASEWLSKNDESHGFLTNHLAAAAAALENVYQLSGKAIFRSRSQYYLEKIIKEQSEEGWYSEYGGCDPGYQTHGMFYLARLYDRTKESDLLSSLKRASQLMSYFIHPDGSIGGEYSSRNTSFYYPAAFEMLAGVCEYSAKIANTQRPLIARGETVGLRQMDAQNFFPLLNNYIFAFENETSCETKVLLAFEREVEEFFEHAGLLVKSTPTYFSILNVKKGGVLKVWDRSLGKLIFQSSGYVCKKRGKVFSTQSVSTFRRRGEEILIEAPFVRINQRVFSPAVFLGFRLFSILFGRFSGIARWLKQLLVASLITKREFQGGGLIRKVNLRQKTIEVIDKFENLDADPQPIDKFASIHMGSSRYVHLQEEIQRAKIPALSSTNNGKEFHWSFMNG